MALPAKIFRALLIGVAIGNGGAGALTQLLAAALCGVIWSEGGDRSGYVLRGAGADIDGVGGGLFGAGVEGYADRSGDCAAV
jgi:hypothetical protein